jgi:hypothetical protein
VSHSGYSPIRYLSGFKSIKTSRYNIHFNQYPFKNQLDAGDNGANCDDGKTLMLIAAQNWIKNPG